MTRSIAAADLLAAVAELPPGRLADFLDELYGQRCVEDAGWHVRRRRRGVEKYPVRNAQIRAARATGRTLGELALDFGLSKSGIRGVLRRGNVCTPNEQTHPAGR